MDWKTWFHSIAAAAIGGAANALMGALAMPESFNFTHGGLVNLGKLAVIGAIVPVLTLLKQSPLPGDTTVTTTVTKTPPGSVTKTVEETVQNPHA